MDVEKFIKDMFSNSPTFMTNMNMDMDMEADGCNCGDSCDCSHDDDKCGCGGKKQTFVYGFDMKVGEDGKPVFTEWGNMPNPITGEMPNSMAKPKIEEKAVVDFIDNPAEGKGKIIAEMPGVNKDDIKLTFREGVMHIHANGEVREYKEKQILPRIDEKSIKASYKNGILEITFNYDDSIKSTNVKVE